MPAPSPDDVRACGAMLRAGSRSFHAASLLLPARVRVPATALYAFCRLGDDAVDAASDPRAGLERMRRRLDRAYAGAPLDHPADRAFASVAGAHAIPRALPEALLEGFAWDVEGRRVPDLAALHAYAARVAGSVGAMMSCVMGVRTPEALARAADLGVAMQLTNIARDVGADARLGRLYLPEDWLREAGLAPVPPGRFTPALGRVVGRLLDEAETLYRRGLAGVALLPAECRPAIRAAAGIYAAIGDSIRARGMDSVSARATVSMPRRLRLLLGAALPRRGDASLLPLPPLPATAFLVAAAVRPPPPGRLEWLLDLLTRMERREQARRSAGPAARSLAGAGSAPEACRHA